MSEGSRPRYNRDEDQRPGRPPRPSTEPKGAERSSRSGKTMTDPGSGETVRPRHPPNRSESDESEGGGDV